MGDPTSDGPPPRNRGRAARRHQRERMIARARRSLMALLRAPSEREAFARKHRDHLASCSCPMCGNPRRWSGERTLQERRAGAPRVPDDGTNR